ncbi:FAD-binding oxidoreductase [Microvirga puerhi]|uniref:FAD-binding oxidoreductase n=1 Tax=Microvirga puerhi TaxID=2876078 RepID=A0ABS7VNU4_9HYPH|nr:FAD-binding oxidoreductase [Microvirga puerhi]MBZ6077209.1 FAD-binding oxidoreductase [Microvirga puerhi]
MHPLATILNSSSVVTDPDGMAPYLSDWRGLAKGTAQAVVKPQTTEDVARVLQWASQTGTPVVPQGGNTGLSGGATPDRSGRAIVLSLERLNRILSIDPVGNTLVAQAGCILANVQQAAADVGRLFPVSLGSEGSCQIGGILATNAGGINVIRYGMTRDLVLGLEYVTAAGEIVRGPRKLHKNNTGYDLRHLLIGSEGSLAVITAAALKIVQPPPARISALAAVGTPDAALSLLRLIRETVGENILAFELMCGNEMNLVRARFPSQRYPFADNHPWYVFVEIGGERDEVVSERTEAALSHALDKSIVTDAVLATSEAQSKEIWHLRFAVSEANRLAGPTVSHDVSVATQDVPTLIANVSRRIADFPEALPLLVGHIGDGNIHVNILLPHQILTDQKNFRAISRQVNDMIYDIVGELDGSISAEHGIGRFKREAFSHRADPVELRLMTAIKHSFDPAGILNPGVMLSASQSLRP